MQYQNPILTGFHPDPSVCRVGKDFYLVNSSFEYFPGIPIYHSTDLVNWEQIGHVLTRNSQLTLANGAPNCIGIYAPTLRYHDGIYYCIVTNVGGEAGGNFFVYTTDSYGEWSDPVRLPYGGIDPSLFFDEDGSIYYSGTDESVYIAALSWKITPSDTPDALPVLSDLTCGEKHYIWDGSGGNNPEGPHVYKINGMYYLMIAEGGTEYCHMVTIARSSHIYGPYENCPRNPIMTNRSTGLPIKAIGHADLVTDEQGNWWAVCLGIRPLGYPFRHNLGRETMLVPVTWENGWPVMGNNGLVEENITTAVDAGVPTPASEYYRPGSNMEDTFMEPTLHPSWNIIYNPVDGLLEHTSSGLILHGNQHALSVDEPKALICRRQEHFDFSACVTLTLLPASNETMQAGISIYMNNRHHYEAYLEQTANGRFLVLRRQIGKLAAEEARIPYTSDTVTLQLCGSRESYTFSYQDPQNQDRDAFLPIGSGEASYLTTEAGGCFTGNYIALYAAGGDAKLTKFTYLSL